MCEPARLRANDCAARPAAGSRGEWCDAAAAAAAAATVPVAVTAGLELFTDTTSIDEANE